ncbi:organic cation transporter-related family protein [Striga asiatica]|uniref:Organic cation transporter-related family protein n=1 Tax=Striga asiatica TaxID=4170 RepID=A0A5A7QQB8_STRAF|nr:organic cation transporter-related family protein [Striga asiatica]
MALSQSQHRLRTLDEAVETHIGEISWKQVLQLVLISLACFFDAQQNFITIFTDAHPRWSCNSQSPAACADMCRLRRAHALSCLIMSVFGSLTVFSVNVWMYAELQFMSSLGRAVIGSCSFVLGSELVGQKWRGKIRHFRLLYSIIVYFPAHESPRWLYIKGKNGSSHWNDHLLTENYVEQNHSTAFKVLFQRKWAVKRLIMNSVAGFAVGLAYYGMPLGLGSLHFNLYINVGMNAMSSLLSNVAMLFVIERMRRKVFMGGLCLLSGVCNLVGVFVRPRWKIGMELLFFSGGHGLQRAFGVRDGDVLDVREKLRCVCNMASLTTDTTKPTNTPARLQTPLNKYSPPINTFRLILPITKSRATFDRRPDRVFSPTLMYKLKCKLPMPKGIS